MKLQPHNIMVVNLICLERIVYNNIAAVTLMVFNSYAINTHLSTLEWHKSSVREYFDKQMSAHGTY